MWAVCLQPDNGNTAFVDQVPVLSDAVVCMMRYQREKVYNCSGMAANDVHEMDLLWGMDLDDDGMCFNDMVHLLVWSSSMEQRRVESMVRCPEVRHVQVIITIVSVG